MKPFLYAAVPVLLGMIPGGIAFAVNPDVAEDIALTAVPVPAWVFVVVWGVIYAGMGMAVWRVRVDTDDPVPVVLLAVGFTQTVMFWLADGLRAVAVADATGLLLAAATFWVFARRSRAAARWLLPWVVWMPITLVIKVAVLM